MPQTPYSLGADFEELNQLEARDDFELQTQIRNTLRLLRPQRALGVEKARFGGPADGGYVHLDDFKGVDTAVSLGIDHNITWDLDLADRGLSIHQFDHTVDAPAPEDHRLIFNETMITPSPEPGGETLDSIVRRLDKRNERPNIILKMDIERCEWAVLEEVSKEALSRFSQITGEFHYFEGPSELSWRQTFFRCLRKINEFYAPIHIHGNNYTELKVIDNIPVPCVMEITFANRLLYDFEDSDEIFPTPLDAPCRPWVPDHYLGTFRY